MKKVTVLLADDHAVVRAGIANALKELPNLEIVGEVGDGPTLLAMLAQTPPDCLLIDVTMPNFEPIVTIQQIRTDYPDMKILVVSAYDDNVYVQGLLGAGVNGYHLKDQPLSDLRLAVQRVLAGQKWVSSRLVDKLVNHKKVTPITPRLTTRQREVLRLLQRGLDNQNIALQMGLSIKTVENHLTRLYRQLGVQSRLEAVKYVLHHPKILETWDKSAVYPDTLTASPSESLTMLLVDDNARYRHHLCRMVSTVSPQAKIFEAENIQEAIHLVKQVSPQLVLIDVVLGDESGIQCTHHINQAAPASRVILISAYPDREFHRLGLEAGAVAFLDKKDLDAATLRQVIEDLIL